MKSKKEIIKSGPYWLAHLQVELFNQLKNYMEKNHLTQNDLAKEFKVSKGHISQILNGDSNFTLKKLIDLSLRVGKVPVIKFVNSKKYLCHEKEINKFFENFENFSENSKEGDVRLGNNNTASPGITESNFKRRSKSNTII